MHQAPALFVGHGSPLNAIQDNLFTQAWRSLAASFPRPLAIVAVSAHWFTEGTKVSDVEENRTLYDMTGFPDALYRVVYGAPGAPALAAAICGLLGMAAAPDSRWGLDHGAWSVLTHLYPGADIPVLQVSVDRSADTKTQFALGKALGALRREGVMVLGSGNVVHNLGCVDWQNPGGYPWADSFDAYIRDAVVARDFSRAVDYRKAGDAARLAVPTMDHFAPLLYALGAADEHDTLTVFNDARTMGSLSMTGYLFA